MKRSITTVWILTISFLGLWRAVESIAAADPGLLIIAHGARSESWNDPVLEFGEKVAREAIKQGRFKAVRTAMLEAAQPDVPRAVAELEAAGCDRIVAVPLLIAPSGHSHFDVPTVLGIYCSAEVNAAIEEEGGAVARPKVPIILTQTIDAETLCAFAADQVRQLSRNADEEAVVVIAHGDADHHGLVDNLMRRITTYCCGQAGIDYGDWAFVEVGQSYIQEGIPSIVEAARHKKRVLVVGMYVSSSARTIHERAMGRTPDASSRFARFFQEHDVEFSTQGVVTHPDAVRWVLETADRALRPLSAPASGARDAAILSAK
jgi:hypothetical protein